MTHHQHRLIGRFTRAALVSVLALPFFAAAGHAQLLPKPPCTWIDAGPWRLQSSPGSVTAGPLLNAGPHVVWVAEKLEKGPTPYTLWRPYGPFNVQAGKKYLVTIQYGAPLMVAWLPEDVRLNVYSNPAKSGAVYFYNHDDKRFFGVAVCPGTPGLITPPPTPATAKVVLKTAATLAKGDPLDTVRKTCFRRIHELRLEQNRAYTIAMASKDFDAFLRLEDPSGKQVAQDDDSGPGLDAEIRAFKPAVSGVYRIIATTFRDGATGNYDLTVATWTSQVIMKQEADLTSSLVIGPDKIGVPYVKGKFYRSFDVSLKVGVNYVIDLESTAFDAFLVLEDSAGRVLGWDDDSGGARNSRLNFQVPLDGTYRIVVTSFSPGGTGRFQMTVRAEE
ncbi:MAG: PPC domain-containing protein [Gemmataceae bacterium]